MNNCLNHLPYFFHPNDQAEHMPGIQHDRNISPPYGRYFSEHLQLLFHNLDGQEKYKVSVRISDLHVILVPRRGY